jgi:uncharacterized protein YjeT (DUF2065 family)
MVFLLMVACGAGNLAGQAWMHFSEQLLTGRRQLLPGFLAPQVTAFCAIWLLIIVGCPLAARPGEYDFLFLVAFSAVAFASVGVFIVTLSVPVLAVIAAAWLGVSGGKINVDVAGYAAGDHPGKVLLALAATILATVWAMVRLCRASEDSPAAFRRFSFARWVPKQRMSGEKVVEMHGYLGHAARIAMPAGGSLWSRARAWSCLGGAGLRVVILMPAMVLVSQWCLSPMSGHESLVFWFCLMLILPSLTLMIWPRLWRQLALDSLRPLDRDRFLAEVGLAIAMNVGRTWLLLVGGCIAGQLLIANSPTDLPALLAAIAASLGAQVFLFALGVWLLRYRTKALAAPMISMPLMICMLMSYCRHASNLWPTAIGAGTVLAILGALIVRDAWRRWLVTELG